jgi:hypothetical protein
MVGEGVFYMNTLHPVRSNRDVDLPESLAWVRNRVGSRAYGNRILNAGTTGVFPEWGSALQMPQLETVNLGWQASYSEFFTQYVGIGLFLSLDSTNSIVNFTPASLSVVGVQYLIVDRSMTAVIDRARSFGFPVVKEDRVRLIFENPRPLARAIIAGQLIHAKGLPDEQSISTTATTLDEQLESEARRIRVPVLDTNTPTVTARGAGEVSVTRYTNTKVDLTASLNRPGILVLMDSWHPNWKATVDGVEAHLGRVNIAFRGIALPAGTHRVELHYQPKLLQTGIFLTVSTMLGLLGIICMHLRRSRLQGHRGN